MQGFQTTYSNAQTSSWLKLQAVKVVATAALFKAEAAYETALCLWQASKMFGWSDSQTPAEIQEAYGAAVKEYVVTMDQAELNRCQSLQGPTNDFAAGEEGAYVTEQQAIAAANRTCATSEADANQTRSDAIATAQAAYVQTVAGLQGPLAADIDQHYKDLRLALAGYEQTRAYAYADAYENYAEDTAADAATHDTAISAALQTQANADAAAGQTLGDALAAADQTEQNAIAAADQAQAGSDAAAETTFAGTVAAAAATQGGAYASANTTLVTEEGTAMANWASQWTVALVAGAGNTSGQDPQAMAVAGVWGSYVTTSVAAYGQQMALDANALQLDIQQLDQAVQTQTQNDAAADAALTNAVAQAGVTWTRTVAAAATQYAKSVDAAMASEAQGLAADQKTYDLAQSPPTPPRPIPWPRRGRPRTAPMPTRNWPARKPTGRRGRRCRRRWSTPMRPPWGTWPVCTRPT